MASQLLAPPLLPFLVEVAIGVRETPPVRLLLGPTTRAATVTQERSLALPTLGAGARP